MADFSKLKKISKFGTPPALDEVKNNLQQPEVFYPVEAVMPVTPEQNKNFVDGRTLRKTGRTHQLSTRVTDDFYRRVRMIASRDDLKIVELLEKAIDVYEFERIEK